MKYPAESITSHSTILSFISSLVYFNENLNSFLFFNISIFASMLNIFAFRLFLAWFNWLPTPWENSTSPNSESPIFEFTSANRYWARISKYSCSDVL